MALPTTATDQAALDLWTARGDLTVPTAASTAELSPQEAVFLSLSRHLARVEAAVEGADGTVKPQSFVDVLTRWPDAWERAQYPRAVLSAQTTTERDAITGEPVDDPRGGDADFISDDDAWALWRLGEDIGTGQVMIFANYQPVATALAHAVQQALMGSIDRRQGIALPLPDVALPPPFRGLLAPDQGFVACVELVDGGVRAGEEDGTDGVWRATVQFTWQAPRFAARPRIPDLDPRTDIAVGPSGQEI